MNTLSKTIQTSITTACLLLSTAVAGAQPPDFETHPLSDISETAVSYALNMMGSNHHYKEVSAEARSLDERLRLRKCEEALVASSNNQLINKVGRTSVSIRCNGANPWSLFVPVTISALTPVVMLKGPLPRGTVILEQHLEVRDMPVDKLPPNYLSNSADVVGRELNRFVNNESFATAHMLKVKNLVEKGQTVIIQAGNNGIQVKMSGVALEPGQYGDRINVKNSSSGLTVQGRISDAGIVMVSL